ncbi:hypothetical protein [Streptomyces sp. NPDC055056]
MTSHAVVLSEASGGAGSGGLVLIAVGFQLVRLYALQQITQITVIRLGLSPERGADRARFIVQHVRILAGISPRRWKQGRHFEQAVQSIDAFYLENATRPPRG